MKISVIICTHNPQTDYLQRVLDALRDQTLSKTEWELLLIDNASRESLAGAWDLSWHPAARCIREDELGLTPARLRGIKEGNGELLVFVDDDNVLFPDYLERAWEISTRWPALGAWGGQLFPEFEVPPAPELAPHLPLVGVAEFSNDRWSNLCEGSATPCGAGMCIRREVAGRYVEQVESDESRRRLDRRGADLASGGDTDMALTACDLGLGTGNFVALKLRHLIPRRRLELGYLLRLRESMTRSQTVLVARRKPDFVPPTYALRFADVLRTLTKPKIDRAFRFATFRGRARALRLLGLRSRLF